MRYRLASSAAACALILTAALAGPQEEPNREVRFSADRFMEHDADGDGKLERRELPVRFADRMFEGADANEDGYIDRAELDVFFAARFAARREPGQDRGAPQADFGRSMSQAGRALRQLSRSPLNMDSLERDLQAVSTLQTAIVGAKSQMSSVPPTGAEREKYGDDVAGYTKAFRLGLLAVLAESMTLERALLDYDGEKTRASVQRLIQLRNGGHDAYQPIEVDPPAPDA